MRKSRVLLAGVAVAAAGAATSAFTASNTVHAQHNVAGYGERHGHAVSTSPTSHYDARHRRTAAADRVVFTVDHGHHRAWTANDDAAAPAPTATGVGASTCSSAPATTRHHLPRAAATPSRPSTSSASRSPRAEQSRTGRGGLDGRPARTEVGCPHHECRHPSRQHQRRRRAGAGDRVALLALRRWAARRRTSAPTAPAWSRTSAPGTSPLLSPGRLVRGRRRRRLSAASPSTRSSCTASCPWTRTASSPRATTTTGSTRTARPRTRSSASSSSASLRAAPRWSALRSPAVFLPLLAVVAAVLGAGARKPPVRRSLRALRRRAARFSLPSPAAGSGSRETHGLLRPLGAGGVAAHPRPRAPDRARRGRPSASLAAVACGVLLAVPTTHTETRTLEVTQEGTLLLHRCGRGRHDLPDGRRRHRRHGLEPPRRRPDRLPRPPRSPAPASPASPVRCASTSSSPRPTAGPRSLTSGAPAPFADGTGDRRRGRRPGGRGRAARPAQRGDGLGRRIGDAHRHPRRRDRPAPSQGEAFTADAAGRTGVHPRRDRPCARPRPRRPRSRSSTDDRRRGRRGGRRAPLACSR